MANEIINNEIYDLVYVHYKKNGELISDPDDYLLCDQEDIDDARAIKLINLLVPVSSIAELVVPFDSAKILASWGFMEGVDYFQYCVTNRVHKLGMLNPHNLTGHDLVYEEIVDSLRIFSLRCDEKSLVIQPLLLEILELSKTVPFRLVPLLRLLERKKWVSFKGKCQECLIANLQSNSRSRIDYWNAIDLACLLRSWDVGLLKDVEKLFGVIDIPESQDRMVGRN